MITCIKYSGKKTSTINLEKINLIRDRVWVNVTSPNEKELKKLVPVNRFGNPEEVAHLVSFLASEKASYITGEVVNINGGIYS